MCAYRHTHTRIYTCSAELALTQMCCRWHSICNAKKYAMLFSQKVKPRLCGVLSLCQFGPVTYIYLNAVDNWVGRF